MQLEGRHAVVTGGLGALGRAVSAALADAGATVHVFDVAAGEAGRAGVIVHPPLDLGNELAVVAAYEGLPALWASVHCAGGFAMSPIAETPLAELRRMVAMNVETCFLCSREAVRAIRRTGGGGRIVNVASRQALEPRIGAGAVAYTVAKAGVRALTEALGEEVAGEGIRVSAVAPSIMDTAANRAAMPKANHAAWASVEDVARVIAFLASPTNAVARSAVVPFYCG